MGIETRGAAVEKPSPGVTSLLMNLTGRPVDVSRLKMGLEVAIQSLDSTSSSVFRGGLHSGGREGL